MIVCTGSSIFTSCTLGLSPAFSPSVSYLARNRNELCKRSALRGKSEEEVESGARRNHGHAKNVRYTRSLAHGAAAAGGEDSPQPLIRQPTVIVCRSRPDERKQVIRIRERDRVTTCFMTTGRLNPFVVSCL